MEMNEEMFKKMMESLSGKMFAVPGDHPIGKLLGMLTGHQRQDEDEDEQYKNFKQCARLDSEETIEHKELGRQHDNAIREIQLLQRQADVLAAKLNMGRDKFWNGIYKNHGLPMKGSYHITQDFRILVDPKSLPGRGKKKDEGSEK